MRGNQELSGDVVAQEAFDYVVRILSGGISRGNDREYLEKWARNKNLDLASGFKDEIIAAAWNFIKSGNVAELPLYQGGGGNDGRARIVVEGNKGSDVSDHQRIAGPGGSEREGDDQLEGEETELEEEKWPEGVHGEAMAGLAGEIVRAIDPVTEADPVAVLANLLAMVGNLVGPKPHFKVFGQKHGLRLFVVTVGSTAAGKKGTATGAAKEFFRMIDDGWVHGNVCGGISSGEALVWAVRDKPPVDYQKPVKPGKEVFQDPGVTDKRLLIVETELSRLFRVMTRQGNTMSSTIRDAWDSGDLSNRSRNTPAVATGAHISIIGHITRQELEREMQEIDAWNGFGNRFLWFLVRQSKQIPLNDLEVNFGDLIPAMQEARTFAEELAASGAEFEMAPKAEERWREIYPEFSKAPPSVAGSMMARGAPQVRRLACIYAILDRSRVIRRENLESAIDLWEYSRRCLELIFKTDNWIPPDERKIEEELKRWIPIVATKGGPFATKAPYVARAEIRDHFSRHVRKEKLDKVLRRLIETGYLKMEKEKTNGRSIERWGLCR